MISDPLDIKHDLTLTARILLQTTHDAAASHALQNRLFLK
jgi:hypothetical protein